MVTRAKKIDPVAVATHALKQVKSKLDYARIVAANETATIEVAWANLTAEEQEHIYRVCDETPQPDLSAIATELSNCTALIQLQAVKACYGEVAIKGAWKLLTSDEKRRLKEICDGQQPTEAVQNSSDSDARVNEQSANTLTKMIERVEPKLRTLFSISTDLEKLNELLDECGDDTQQRELINQWFEQLGSERDTKLDAYAALISEMVARAAVRKAEAQRMQELAASDENRARLLKERLKWFFESHDLKTVETARYKLSLQRNGGKQPLILKEGLSPTELPERFQKVSIDPDTTTIREALERGETLEWAMLGERGSSIRIK